MSGSVEGGLKGERECEPPELAHWVLEEERRFRSVQRQSGWALCVGVRGEAKGLYPGQLLPRTGERPRMGDADMPMHTPSRKSVGWKSGVHGWK